MQSVVQYLSPGWNLGDTLDVIDGSETRWGNPKVTRRLIRAIARCGFKCIHLPITWGHRMGPAPDYTVNPQFMERVKKIVDWCLGTGMTTVIDLHHDSDWVYPMETNHDEIMKKFTSLWTQIAISFWDYPSTLIFECINEPRFSNDWDEEKPEYFRWVNELNNCFYRAVRNTGGGNAQRPLIMVPLVHGVSQSKMDALYDCIKQFGDPYLIAGLHYYGEYNFSVNVGGASKFTKEAMDNTEAVMQRADATFNKRGVPAFIAEYGLLAFDEGMNGVQHGEMLKYFEHLTHTAHKHLIAMSLWDHGQHFNREKLIWRDKAFYETIMHGLGGGRSSHTERDYIFLRDGDEVKDAVLPLHLNGNALKHIRQGIWNFNNYTASDDTLTIHAEWLKYIKNPVTLRMVFDSGPDWKLHVIPCALPLLAAAEGKRELVIPVDFNGDIIETMEAFAKKNGALVSARPEDWSAYKQYNVSFVPDVSKGCVTIPGKFFEENGDGEFLLRFWFLSGAEVEYSVTKKGRKINGKPVM
jgi:hypothetical protein